MRSLNALVRKRACSLLPAVRLSRRSLVPIKPSSRLHFPPCIRFREGFIGVSQLHCSARLLSIHQYREERSDETVEERTIKYNLSQAVDRFDKEEYLEALQSYEQVLRDRPDNVDALTGKAACLQRLGRFLECVSVSERVILLCKNVFGSDLIIANEFRRLAQLHLALKNFCKAHKAIREALHLSPSQILLDLKNRVESDGDIKLDIVRPPIVHTQVQEELGDIPVNLREASVSKGRGLFASKALSDGDPLFLEAPLVSCIDLESQAASDSCAHCLRQLRPFKFRFSSAESRDLLNSMPEETLAQLKAELSAQFAPPLQITERSGFRFCSPTCAEDASNSWLDVLLPYITDRDARLMFLMPSLFPGRQVERNFNVRERACTELVTLLVAKNVRYPETWSRWGSRLSYAVYRPEQPLLDHEMIQLQYLRALFPSQADILSEANFQRMKSAVDLNAFSIETNQIAISLGLASPEVAESDQAPSPNPSGQLSVHVDIDDAEITKGHALYRLGSFLNHSCDPNVGMISPSFSSRAQWSLLKPVQSGQELTNSYIPLGDEHQSSAERQHLLHLHYKFWCQCSVCSPQ